MRPGDRGLLRRVIASEHAFMPEQPRHDIPDAA